MRTTNYLDSVPELVMPETVTNYYTTMLIKFKTGVGSATFIVRLQDHLPAKFRSLFRVSSHTCLNVGSKVSFVCIGS